MYLQMAYKALMESRSPYDTISVSGHEGLSVELTLSLEFKVQAKCKNKKKNDTSLLSAVLRERAEPDIFSSALCNYSKSYTSS